MFKPLKYRRFFMQPGAQVRLVWKHPGFRLASRGLGEREDHLKGITGGMICRIQGIVGESDGLTGAAGYCETKVVYVRTKKVKYQVVGLTSDSYDLSETMTADPDHIIIHDVRVEDFDVADVQE